MSTTLDPTLDPLSKPNSRPSSDADLKPLSVAARDRKFWRDGAMEGIAGDKALAAWCAHLATRRTPKSLDTLCGTKNSPLNLGLSREKMSTQTVELLELSDQLIATTDCKDVEKTLARWAKKVSAPEQTIDFGLQCLAVAHALPQIAGQSSDDLWWKLADTLWQVVSVASQWRIDEALPPERGLAQQLLAGELPTVLAYFLPEMRPVYKLRNAAREALSEGLVELLNGNGLVQGEYLPYLRPLLACWTRCKAIGEQVKKGAWNRKADEEYQWMSSHAIALSSPAGTSLLSQPHGERWSSDFLRNVVQLGGDEADLSAARSIFGKKLTSALRGKNVNLVPETSDECEWAGVAYMRTEWERSAPTVAVDFSTPNLRLEVWAGPQRLLAGDWNWETTVGGKKLEPVGSWDEICWFTDDDVDYLELSIELTDGAQLDRQIVLARDEQFLLLVDTILLDAGNSAGNGEISHSFRLPLDNEVEFRPEEETREGTLGADKPVARVLPLALPEWRADPRIGQLRSSASQLELEQTREGQNMACPLLIDLKKSRATKPCTWRQLTVAESLEIQPHDVAVGYRAQCGKQQWLFYRSLAEAANRTLLGQNVSSECLVARFLASSGEIDELLEIEV